MESIGCVLCNQSESKPVIEDNGFVGRQCTSCGLIFVSPRPSQREMDTMYEEGRAYLSPEFFVANSDFLAERAHAKREVKRLRGYVTSGSLLEIGPGRGTFLAEARRNNFDVYGVELNPLQADFIRTQRGIQCVDSIDAIPTLGPKQFDVIYHCSVLSHFHDPVADFHHFYDLLADGGYLMFETGNLADVDHRYFKYVGSFQYPDHLFFFGDRSIRRLLARTGFTHQHTTRYSNLPESIVRAQITRLRKTDRQESAPESSMPDDRTNRRVFRGAGMVARQALDLLYYTLSNTLGAVRASERAPQTFVVVARKPL